MRRAQLLGAAVAVAMGIPAVGAAQDTSRAVRGGGIAVAGWAGKIDAREAAAGQKLENARFVKEGNALHVTTGPAVTYWHPSNRATGDYTVRATFREPKYMALNNHPHPYGIVIGGSGLGTEQQRYLYCAAYGSGRFIMRGFGPTPFQLNGRGEEHAAIKKASGAGAEVTQEIAVTVRGDKVECAINGSVVGSWDKAAVVGDGKLASTDGLYGLRFGHNTEAFVTGLKLEKGAKK
ncbi:MAG TPA: hypothetical protein VEA99_15715 [Gemmatimonadaceae bacterium]|nr:hypothetical protein [Gemmatimonadaceae bacterium]